MNTFVYYGFNVIILAFVVLAVGLFKPKWIFLWMDEPSRFAVVFLAAAIFMGGMVLFGEGNKKIAQEKAAATATANPQAAATAEVPNVVPAPQVSAPVATPPAAVVAPIDAKPATP